MINILVTAIGGGGNGGQVLKCLKFANRKDFRIFGADSDTDCLSRDDLEGSIVLPLATAENYISTLLEFCITNNIRAVFPGCEPELIQLSENRDLFNEQGIYLAINSKDVIRLCMDKSACNQRLIELGFNPPKFRVIKQKSDCELIDWYPLVVKPSFGSGGSSHVYIVQDQDELNGLASYLDLGGRVSQFMAQEYVGTSTSEFTVGVLHDMGGKFINSVALRRHLSNGLSLKAKVKNRTGKKQMGEYLVVSTGISQGTIAPFPEVVSQCRQIAEAISSCGPLNIQCRVENGQVRVFEINPRLSGTTFMRAMVGINEAEAMLDLHVFGKDICREKPYEEATILRTLTEYWV